MVKGGGIGGFGGGWLEHLRQWLGAKGPVLSPWAYRSSRSCQARREEAHARAKLVTANSTLNRAALQKQVVVLTEAQQLDPLRRDGRRGEAPHQAAAHQRRRQQALERTSRLDHVPRSALLAPEGEACTQRRGAGTLDFAPTSIESQYTLQRTLPRAPLSHGGLRDEGAAGPPSAAVPLESYTFRGPSCRYAA